MLLAIIIQKRKKYQYDNFLTIYTLSDTKDKCELNECEEYPQISPGYIIYIGKKKNYFDNKKCQFCRYGYFKTKKEKYVYCLREQYGGSSRYECGYELDSNGNELNNIKCNDCFSFDK